MAKEQSRLKIQADATTEQHLHALRSYGQQYLAHAARQRLPPVARQRLIAAALSYLESRTSSSQPSAHASASQQPLSQGASPATPATLRDRAFQSHLTPLIDGDLPAAALLDSCALAADLQLVDVLAKCLGVLAQFGPLRDLRSEGGIISLSQYQEHELQATPGASERSAEHIVHDGSKRRRITEPVASQLGREGTAAEAETVRVKRTGQSFVDDFVIKLAEGHSASHRPVNPPQSSANNDVFVASVAREAPLSDSATDRVLRTLTDRLRHVDLFELPAFVYQLLLFASRCGRDSAKSRVLLHVAEVFSIHEQTARRADALSQGRVEEDEDAITACTVSLPDLREVQGTALYHIDVVARQDPALAAEVIRLTKSGVENPRHLLSSFGCGIVLLLARSNLLRPDVLPLLREAIVRFDKEHGSRNDDLFVTRVTMNDWPLLDPKDSLLRISESTFEDGWDFVKEGLLDLAFVLLDKPLPQQQRLVTHYSLAKELITKLFESHHVMRPSILQQLQSRVALQEKSAFHAIRIIRTLCESCPSTMLEHQTFIRDCIELLVSLPQWLAAPLMQCFTPFLELRQDLLDFFYLVVRKSLFYRESSTRAVAITGFLTLASVVKTSAGTSGHASQMSQTQMGAPSRREAIIETIQPLRRVFSYSPALRAFLYKNVISLVQIDPSSSSVRTVAAALHDVLIPHVRRFIDIDKPPYLLLDMCVDESSGGAFQEPLGDLVWCLAVTELRKDHGKYHKSHIADLAIKLSSVSLSDFAVAKEPLTAPDETPDPDSTSSQSAQSAALAARNKVRALGSVLEALIHSTLITPPQHFSWKLVEETIVPLLVLKGKVFDLLRGAGLTLPSDTFRDLGGDLDLERLRPAMRMILQRPAKGAGGKKGASGGKKPNKPGDASASAAATGQATGNYRFGVFSVLPSAHTKPSLSLESALKILKRMGEAMGDSQDDRNPFIGRATTQDFQELRVYLLSVAHKHIDEFVQIMGRWTVDEPEVQPADVKEMAGAVETLVGMAMSDFKRFRRAASDGSQGGLRALQIGESCAAALPLLVHMDEEYATSFCKALLPNYEEEDDDEEDEEISNGGICEKACAAMERLIENLFGDELYKEAMAVLRIHDHVYECVAQVKGTVGTLEKKSKFLGRRVAWATRVFVGTEIGDGPLVKRLVRTAMTYTDNNNDVRAATALSERLMAVIGAVGSVAEPPGPSADDSAGGGGLKGASGVQQDVAFAVVDAVCDLVERGLSDVEWCLHRMASLETVLEVYFSAVSGGGGEAGAAARDAVLHERAAKLANRAESAAQKRLQGLVRVQLRLLRCTIVRWAYHERMIRAVSRTYRLLSSATQAQARRSGEPSPSFLDMIAESKRLSVVLSESTVFNEAGNQQQQGLSAAKSRSEARIKAQVIYDEERFHQQLIAANKKTHTNLLVGLKRSVARDFRISEDLLAAEDDGAQPADERQEDVGGEGDGEGEGDGGDGEDVGRVESRTGRYGNTRRGGKTGGKRRRGN